jgi:hypothetical protein
MNSSRLNRITYPEGRYIEYGYGSASSIDDLSNRIKGLKDGASIRRCESSRRSRMWR